MAYSSFFYKYKSYNLKTLIIFYPLRYFVTIIFCFEIHYSKI